MKNALISVLQRSVPLTRGYGLKASLMKARGFDVKPSVRIVSSASFLIGGLTIGDETFIGHNVRMYGGQDSEIVIGDRCDIAPEVAFFAGTHTVADSSRRAGPGKSTKIVVEDGCWIGGRAVLIGPCRIGAGSVIAAGSIVRSDVPRDSMYYGPNADNRRPLVS